MKHIRHQMEAVGLRFLFALFRALPLDLASWFGGFMARAIGPFLSAHKTAHQNLFTVFPAKTEEERRAILIRMWDNLGRVAAELAHLNNPALYRRITLHGAEHLSKPDDAALYFSGHIGNWELLAQVAYHMGNPLTLVYRQANNRYVDDYINQLRMHFATDLVPKGFKGAAKLVRAIKQKQSIAMLVDQKMNDGIAVPFFGKPAMTAPAIAQFALRYGMRVIPAHIRRIRGAHFECIIEPPLHFTRTDNESADILSAMATINQRLESWILECPEQWFWVHRRWPKYSV